MSRQIDRIIIHASATRPDQDIGVAEIRDWHVNGNGWSDIGYHWVIRRDGTVEPGRPERQAGAHARGHNDTSLGVCMVGGVDGENKPSANYTRRQWAALSNLVDRLVSENPGAEVLGHRDLPGVWKACPCFPVAAWLGE